jgi:hypothetical protein
MIAPWKKCVGWVKKPPLGGDYELAVAERVDVDAEVGFFVGALAWIFFGSCQVI